MTAEVDANELRDAVERLHGCPAQLVEAVSVSESFEGRPVWRGIVHIFDLRGIGRPTDATLGRRRLRGATSAASLLCSTRRRLPRRLMQFARRSVRSLRPIGMALKSALSTGTATAADRTANLVVPASTSISGRPSRRR